MPWGRIGDTAAHHPTVLAVLEHEDADDRIVNELFGFVLRCATQSAAHLTDYVINRGTAVSVAGASRAKALLDFGIYAGYLVEMETVGEDGHARKVYKVIDDPDFIHIRTKEEIEFERQRKSDNSDPALIVPIRLRDGDACRYCGMVVNWKARKGRLAGTYDHRVPGQKATVDTYVVSCTGCNAGRGNDMDADKRYPLLPEPLKPYYSPHTREWLENNDWRERNGFKVPKPPASIVQPGKHAGNGHSRPATIQGNGSNTSGPTPAVPAPATGSSLSEAPSGDGKPSSSTGQDSAAPSPPEPPTDGPDRYLRIPVDPAERECSGSGFTGTGRDGSGRDGEGRGPDLLLSPAAHLNRPPNSAGIPKPSTQGKKNRRRTRPRNRKGNPNV